MGETRTWGQCFLTAGVEHGKNLKLSDKVKFGSYPWKTLVQTIDICGSTKSRKNYISKMFHLFAFLREKNRKHVFTVFFRKTKVKKLL
jgi:hypothetical protein